MNTTNTEIYKRMFAESMIKRNCNNVITRSTTENNESNESDNNEYNLSDGITCYFRIGMGFVLEFSDIEDIKYSYYPFDSNLMLSIMVIDESEYVIKDIGHPIMITKETVYDTDDKIYSIEGYTNLYYNDNDKKLYYKNENDNLEMIKNLPIISQGFNTPITGIDIEKLKKFMNTNYHNNIGDNKYLVFCK